MNLTLTVTGIQCVLQLMVDTSPDLLPPTMKYAGASISVWDNIATASW